MTIDALRAGLRLEEVELDLEHRATGRNAAGFAAPRTPARRLHARVPVTAIGSR